MNDDSRGGRPAVRQYLLFLTLAAVAAALLAAVGWLPTRRLAGAEGLEALLVACALCWLASALGGVPVLLAALERRREGPPGGTPRSPLTAVLGASLVRFVAVVGLAVVAVLSGRVAPAPLLVWTALGYLTLLVVDTWYAVRATGG